MRQQGCNADGVVLVDFYEKHDPVDLDCTGDVGMTRQEFAAECDINVLLDRYERTGVLSHVSRREPLYADLTTMPTDLQGMLQALDRATEAFMTLPAKVRREFDQDPVKFVAFCEDPNSLPQLRDWGLAPPLPEPEAVPPVVVPSVPTGGTS